METSFFATASAGTEGVLADELSHLTRGRARAERGGVRVTGTLEDAYRACLWSRIASRILLPVCRFVADDPDGFYEGVRTCDWTEHVDPRRTLALDAAGGHHPAGPPNYLVLKAKDAIVDRVRDARGTRPSVDTRDPDLRINVHLREREVTVSLDLAGRGLHRRRIGRAGAAAPLKENLAAAVLALAGWPEQTDRPLLDPLCGSGTILIEAAWIALDVAPGLARRRIGAEGWAGHVPEMWERLREEARERRRAARGRRAALAIRGYDQSQDALEAATKNLDAAGLAGVVRVEHRPLESASPPWDTTGLVVTNPPYGARLGTAPELGPLYQQLGDRLRREFPGWNAWILTGNPALGKRIGLKPRARHVLRNGPIECRLLDIPISTTPVVSPQGPGWRKPSPEARGFGRKLARNLRTLSRWAAEHGLECYRVYDADDPVFNVAVDRYGDHARLEEYARPKKLDPALADRRLEDARLCVAETLEVPLERVVVRVRARLAPGEQHERRDARRELFEVREGDLRFLVNLSDYLDTGLFLDDRILRARIRERAAGRDFLNLFAYTCTASVAAAAGGARSTTSLDLSKRYLEWGTRNFAANGIEGSAHRTVRTDVLRDLARSPGDRRYGLVYLAPPTFSRSKSMETDFDLRADHPDLIANAARRLAPGGELLFSTHCRDFQPDAERLTGLRMDEITEEVTPRDFLARPRLRAFRVVRTAKV